MTRKTMLAAATALSAAGLIGAAAIGAPGPAPAPAAPAAAPAAGAPPAAGRGGNAPPQPGLPANYIDESAGKARVFVLSDMGNEPDDQMSMVRILTYANEMDIEGFVATTSTWQRSITRTDTMLDLIGAYGQVRPNLLLHAQGWPTADSLAAITKSGQPGYGMASTGVGQSSDGARLLIAAVDKADPRPLWVGLWGGGNTLAQALIEVRATRTPEQLAAFISKIRVYSISDQDDANAWMRREFPALFWVGQASAISAADYPLATWTGISGDRRFNTGPGADFTKVTNEWLEENIRAKGPLGAKYPRWTVIMEGDTPAFLGMTGNGLNSWRNPGWGGWGGRYTFRTPYGEPRSFWTQGSASMDAVRGFDGSWYRSDHATIWRWRDAYQNDFAARMDWTVRPVAQANHNPVVVVNGQTGTGVVRLDATVGQPLALDLAGTRDPDSGQNLTYRLWRYVEASAPNGAQLTIAGAETNRPVVTVSSCTGAAGSTVLASASAGPYIAPPAGAPAGRAGAPTPAANAPAAGGGRAGGGPAGCAATAGAHLILEVNDNGSPSLTSYRRILLSARAAPAAT